MNPVARYKKYDKKELETMLSSSYSYIDCLKKMGYSSNCGVVIGKFKDFLVKNDISTLFLKRDLKKYSFEQTFCENSQVGRTSIKKRIIRDKLLPYECVSCGAQPFWNEKPLVLVLDHINGISNDNRLSNLRFMCPNCNSQQDTFAGKNKKYKKDLNVHNYDQQIKINVFFKDKELILKELPNCRTLKELKQKTGLSLGKIRAIRKKENINMDYFFTVEHLRSEVINSLKSEPDIIKIASIFRTTKEIILKIRKEENIVFNKKKVTNSEKPRRTIIEYNKEEMRNTIIELLKEHRSMLGVARILGITDNGVKRRCKKLGIDYRYYLDLFHLKEDIRLFISTHSIEATAKKFKTSIKKINKILKKENIPFDPPNKPYQITKKELSMIISKIKNGKTLISISKESKYPYGLIKKIKKNIILGDLTSEFKNMHII